MRLKLDKTVDKAVQILSIDDDRNPSFAPLLWSGRSRSDQMLEQIWMPGVHADVGGCSDATVLGDISLLTMLDRIEEHTDIELDTEYMRSVKENISEMKKLSISYERSGVARKFLRRQARKIISDGNSCIHPIFDVMRGKEIDLKGRRRIYNPINYSEGLKPAHLKNGQFLTDTVCRILDYQ